MAGLDYGQIRCEHLGGQMFAARITPFYELNHADAEFPANGPESQPESRGGLPLAFAGIDLYQSLFQPGIDHILYPWFSVSQ